MTLYKSVLVILLLATSAQTGLVVAQEIPEAERSTPTATYLNVSSLLPRRIRVQGLHAEQALWASSAVSVEEVYDCSTIGSYCIETPDFRLSIPKGIQLDYDAAWNDKAGWRFSVHHFPEQINLGLESYARGVWLISSVREHNGEEERQLFLFSESRGLLGYGIVIPAELQTDPNDPIEGFEDLEDLMQWWTRLSSCDVRTVPYNLICGNGV
ncbi:MAG: hypothetical protein AAF184_22220 [Pseudomonadota bacterium]